MDSHGSMGTGGDAVLRKRVACDVLVHGRVYKGVATELSPHDLFVQLAGSSLPKRGCDVEVHLRDAIGFDGVELRAVVSKQLRADVDAQGLSRGIELRIVDAPPEYHALFEPRAEADDTTEVEILIEVNPGGGSAPPVSPLVAAEAASAFDQDLPVSATAADHGTEPTSVFEDVGPKGRDDEANRPDDDLPDRAVDDDLPATRDPDRSEADLPARRGEDETETVSAEDLPVHRDAAPAVSEEGVDERPSEPAPVEAEAPSEPPASSSAGGIARPANAIVIYDGETLQDVYDLLEEMGAKPERARLSGPTRFQGWRQPPKIVVLDAQDALSVELPPNLIHDGVIRIAIASSASSVIGSMLRSQGFHYMVRRPVHRGALEVLLHHALHRGADRRALARSPQGIDARLRTSRWRWPTTCTLLELSPSGCRVATKEDVPLLSLVWLRIPRISSGSRTVALKARVIRRAYDEAAGEWSVALRFTEVPADQRGRLDTLLARTAIGPTSALIENPTQRAKHLVEGLFRSDELVAEIVEPPEPEPTPRRVEPRPAPERRTVGRAKLDGEVVALDDGRQRVTAVLEGRDLSPLGLRVDPHPEFYVGRKVALALYDTVGRGTIEITAEVVRDDGERGMGLRFIDMEAESAARLERLVESLPEIELDRPRSRAVLLARVSNEPLPEPIEEESDSIFDAPEANLGRDPEPELTGPPADLAATAHARPDPIELDVPGESLPPLEGSAVVETDSGDRPETLPEPTQEASLSALLGGAGSSAAGSDSSSDSSMETATAQFDGEAGASAEVSAEVVGAAAGEAERPTAGSPGLHDSRRVRRMRRRRRRSRP